MNGGSRTILMICPDFPYPPTMGSRIDMWGHVKFFRSEGWRVILAVCMTPEMLARQGTSVPSFPVETECHLLARNRRWSLAESQDTIGGLQALIEKNKPGVVWCEYADFVHLAGALRLGGASLWFRPHNFELAHGLEKSLRDGGRNAWRNPIRQVARLLNIYRAESRMCRISDRLFHISFSDMKSMEHLYRGRAQRTWVLPFVNTTPVPVKRDKQVLDVIYPGSDYSNNVNQTGARKLIEDIIPEVNRAMPGKFLFHITGKNGRAVFGRLAKDNVVLHDFVDDFPGLLAGMDIACLPVELGWGCKLKMIEPLAAGLPVVGSRQAFRGVPPREGAFIVCRTAKDYVRALGSLLPADARERMSANGRKTCESWIASSRSALRAAMDAAGQPTVA